MLSTATGVLAIFFLLIAPYFLLPTSSVGVPISQQTEFDHRLAVPAYQAKSARDGSYRIDNIKGGSYNLVALKDGFGWRYLFDIEIAREKATASEISLYAEKEISGNLNGYQVWEENHHWKR